MLDMSVVKKGLINGKTYGDVYNDYKGRKDPYVFSHMVVKDFFDKKISNIGSIEGRNKLVDIWNNNACFKHLSSTAEDSLSINKAIYESIDLIENGKSYYYSEAVIPRWTGWFYLLLIFLLTVSVLSAFS